MKVVNESHRAMSDILPLVEFVAARAKYADMAYLHLYQPQYDARGNSLVGRAQALKDNDNPAGTTPSRVDIWLSRGVIYPRDNEYPEAGIGVVVLQDWREEFVLVLAHELRHIFHFWQTTPHPTNIEYDAESFGVQVLNEWRAANGRAAILPFHIRPSKPTRKVTANMAARRSK